MNWGDVPSWAFVVVAVCALGVAAVAARQSNRAFLTATEAATRADQARREAGERAQAELVAAWPISERETFQKAIERGVVGAAVRNASPMPIYNIEIEYADEGAGWSAVRRLHIIPPADEPQIFAGFDEEENSGTPAPERVNKDGSVKLVPSAEMRVRIRFADALGRRWSRDDHGVLVSASAQEGALLDGA
jgi:hypothetical protein